MKYSKDPKTIVVSIQEFFENTHFLDRIQYRQWKGEAPGHSLQFYKITSDKLIFISYKLTFGNFGLDVRDNLKIIAVAYRDGITEFKLLEDHLSFLKSEIERHPYSKTIKQEIIDFEKRIKWVKSHFPAFSNEKENYKKNKFSDYLVDTGRKFNTDVYDKKYIVFDVETNGIRRANDDLLSLSIFDPSTGICYNRFFPLDLQPLILTTFVHGITDETIKGSSHWTQDEINDLIEYFDLKHSVILSFSGGKGTFDSGFVKNYCLRHKLKGFEDLDYQNIKSLMPKAPFGSEGSLSKDNLCRIFKIEGVAEKHSSLNDCILEWQLFEKLYQEKLFFIQQHIYAYNPEYIVPVSYLTKYEELNNYAQIVNKPLVGNALKIFEYSFPQESLRKIRKFPTNITGVTIEHCINHLLNVDVQDNSDFLAKNKSHLKYIGSLDSRIVTIPVIPDEDGTFRTSDSKFVDYVDEVNKITKIISSYLSTTIDFIKKNVFNNGPILSQELVVSPDRKVLSLCDLSNDKSVMEIKTYNVLTRGGYLSPNITKQLYYQKKNRATYVLSIDFEENLLGLKGILNNIKLIIYKVEIEEKELEPITVKIQYTTSQLDLYERIQKNNNITMGELQQSYPYGMLSLSKDLHILINNQIIKKEKAGRSFRWSILKDIKKGDFYIETFKPYQ